MGPVIHFNVPYLGYIHVDLYVMPGSLGYYDHVKLQLNKEYSAKKKELEYHKKQLKEDSINATEDKVDPIERNRLERLITISQAKIESLAVEIPDIQARLEAVDVARSAWLLERNDKDTQKKMEDEKKALSAAGKGPDERVREKEKGILEVRALGWG